MYQEFDGIRFYRNTKSGYYERARGVPRKMHVYVWEYYNGPILNGYCVHHIDEDKGNNELENLELLTFSEHARLHNAGEFKGGQSKAREWHSSEEGYKQHSHNGCVASDKWPEREYTCEVCGAKFTQKSPRTDYRFCSNSCKSKWRRDNGIDDEVRECAYCHKQFTVNKYSRTTCCSRSCAAALRWSKKHT